MNLACNGVGIVVTVKEVAKHAGVSLGTVSRVLNGAENVSAQMRERVQNSIRELGYFPNNAARSLVRRRSGTIAILLRNLHSSFFNELIRGFETGMQDSGHNVIFCSMGNEQAMRDQYIQYLTNGVSDAIILYGPLYSDRPIIEHLQSVNFPFMLIENNFRSTSNVNQILIRNLEGAFDAVEYLYSKGHRRIVHFMGDPNKQVNLDRFNGYTQAMQSHGLFIGDDFVYNIYSDNDRARTSAAQIARMPREQRPTAVFCSNDKIAAHAIMSFIESGLRVPEDISVVGFDAQPLPVEGYNGPKITSVFQPLFDIGLDSFRTVVQILNGEIDAPVTHIYDTRLIENDTVAAPWDC